jgi:hypothetical protein
VRLIVLYVVLLLCLPVDLLAQQPSGPVPPELETDLIEIIREWRSRARR